MTRIPWREIPKGKLPFAGPYDLLLHEGNALWVGVDVRDHVNPYWTRYRKWAWDVAFYDPPDLAIWLRENYPEEFL